MRKVATALVFALAFGILATGVTQAQVLGAADVNPRAVTGDRRPQCVLNTAGPATIAAYGTSTQGFCANWATNPTTQSSVRFDQDPTALAVSMPMCWVRTSGQDDGMLVVFDSGDGSFGSQACRNMGQEPSPVHGRPQPVS